jgi:hypothetical protein
MCVTILCYWTNCGHFDYQVSHCDQYGLKRGSRTTTDVEMKDALCLVCEKHTGANRNPPWERGYIFQPKCPQGSIQVINSYSEEEFRDNIRAFCAEGQAKLAMRAYKEIQATNKPLIQQLLVRLNFVLRMYLDAGDRGPMVLSEQMIKLNGLRFSVWAQAITRMNLEFGYEFSKDKVDFTLHLYYQRKLEDVLGKPPPPFLFENN